MVKDQILPIHRQECEKLGEFLLLGMIYIYVYICIYARVVVMIASIGSKNPIKSTPRDHNPRNRPPLLPAEKDNGIIAPKNRPKSKQVSSRYLSPSPSSTSGTPRRSPSPLVSRNPTPSSNNARSVSVDRRRPLPSRPDLNQKLMKNGGDMSAAAKLLVTSSRSLSVSFQGEAYSFPVSKTKAAPQPQSPNVGSLRKGTPEKRRDDTENSKSVDRPQSPNLGSVRKGAPEKRSSNVESSKSVDQHRWPARIKREDKFSRSLNYSAEDKNKLVGSDKVIRALQQSMSSIEGRRGSFDGRLSLNLGNSELLKARELALDKTLFNESDSESVSSGSTEGKRIKPRGIADSARFWQETNSRLRRLQDSGSTLLNSPAKLALKKYSSEGLIRPSSPRTMSSPVRGGIRPSSPSKILPSMASSPSRGMISPSRVRNLISGSSETPSVLSFAVDVRRGKVGENQLVDAHTLRLLYNRHLQWRFVNARAEAALLAQKRSAEKSLWNAWIAICDIRDSVTKKRHRLQLLRQKLKLASILGAQITFLEDWASFEKDHFVSLVGAIEALRASTLRLPVVGATADVQNVKDAIGSAVDMVQGMASSLRLLSSKAEEMNSLMVELAKVIEKESALLDQCKGFFSTLASMQVKNCSLRTHILQHNCYQQLDKTHV